MDEFADVARARASYHTFEEALKAGREIMRRAGVPDPPPVPGFDVVYRKLNAGARAELFAFLRGNPEPGAQQAIHLWTPLIKRAFTSGSAPKPI